MTSPIYGSGGSGRPAAFIDWCFGVVVGLYQPLADNERGSFIRPYLSSAVASEDKEKPVSFFFGLSPAPGRSRNCRRPQPPAFTVACVT